MSKTPFSGSVLIFGCGAICQCGLPIWLEKVDMPPEKITVIDMDASKKVNIAGSLAKGVQFLEHTLSKTEETLGAFLETKLKDGDILWDLSWEIDTTWLLTWCRNHGVMYLNTSLEVWDPCGDAFAQNPHPKDRTLFQRHRDLHDKINALPPLPNGDKGPTGIFEHGANPRLVSHFVMKGLSDISKKLIADPAVDADRKAKLQAALDAGQYNKVCHLTGTKVIHITERDTQRGNIPRVLNEFCNTWSVQGFYEEGIAPVEVAWGSHEKHVPRGAYFHDRPLESPWRRAISNAKPRKGHCFTLPQPGMRTWCRSYSPLDEEEFIGIVMPHGECITVSDALTLYNENGEVENMPSMYFVYCPCDDAISSLREVEMRGYRMDGMKQRILTDEITEGKDKLGTLLLGHDYGAWWCGCLTDIEQTRAVAPGQNATSVQVAAGAIGGLLWAIKNPRQGVLLAEQLPWQEILEPIEYLLGTMASHQVDWNPLKNRYDLYSGWNGEKTDPSDPWQFMNFMVPGVPDIYFD